MPRVAMGAVIALLILGFYYYEPLRTALLAPEGGKSSGAGQKATTQESTFDPKAVELFGLGQVIANLQGKVEVLKLAQENREWFKYEEYAKVPALLQEAEATLKKAESEYERLRNEYAKETATKLVKESIAQSQKTSAASPEGPTPQKAP